MNVGVDLSELMEYTEWQRSKWYETLQQHGDSVLAIGAGEHGDGRFQTVGDLVKHIFSAEKRYVDRLSNRPLTDPAVIPDNSIEGLFEFGALSRRDLKKFVEEFPAGDWDVPQELNPANNVLRVTPRKIIVHVLMHEVRHWAQIGTILRLNGVKGEFHDFLFSPALGGESRSQPA
jgi:uncharacterized damage-inducible protein DinB